VERGNARGKVAPYRKYEYNTTYRLRFVAVNELDEKRIRAALTTRVLGRDLVILPRASSTNDVAKALAAQGAPEGTVV
jgi:hypothetical protein